MANIPYVCLYRSYYEELENFTPEERGRLLWALLEYLCTGQEPDLPEPERYFWPRLRTQHQRDEAHYNETCQRNRANGVKGGKLSARLRSKNGKAEGGLQMNAEHAQTEGGLQQGAMFVPPEAVGPKEREKEKEKEKEREKECLLRMETHTLFSKPDISQVQEYCAEQGITLVDAHKFVAYYDAVGWVCGGKPMKDWKAAVRLWNQTERRKVEDQHGLDGIQPSAQFGTVV